MKIWMISDTHFGKYNNEVEKWLKIMKSYFYEFFIPTLKENYKKGDIVAHLGDVFDNRNSLNLKVVDFVVKLFEDISQIAPVHIITGNHDNFNQSDSEINSVCTIRNIENVFIYEKPTLVEWNGKKVLLMPYIHGKNEEKRVLEEYAGCDLLLCHSDLNGCRTQLYPTRPSSRHILDVEDFEGFKRVFSGHIHICQTINNFTFVGSPYHLDRNDIENKKGIWVYNTKNDKEVFIENNHSPEFKKIRIDSENGVKNLKEDNFKKDFIDLEISKNLILNEPKVRLEIEKITNKYKPYDIRWIDDIIVEKKEKKVHESDKNKSVLDWSIEWIEDKKISDKTDLFTEIEFKSSMKTVIDKCFKLIQQSGKN